MSNTTTIEKITEEGLIHLSKKVKVISDNVANIAHVYLDISERTPVNPPAPNMFYASFMLDGELSYGWLPKQFLTQETDWSFSSDAPELK